MQQIGIRITAGYNYAEVALMLEQHRGDLRHLDLPKDRPVEKTWVQNQVKLLRREIEEVGAATS